MREDTPNCPLSSRGSCLWRGHHPLTLYSAVFALNSLQNDMMLRPCCDATHVPPDTSTSALRPTGAVPVRDDGAKMQCTHPVVDTQTGEGGSSHAPDRAPVPPVEQALRRQRAPTAPTHILLLSLPTAPVIGRQRDVNPTPVVNRETALHPSRALRAALPEPTCKTLKSI